MKKSKYKVYNGKRIKGLLYESKNCFLLILLIIGLITGAFVSENKESIKEIAEKYFQFRKSSGFSEPFFKSAAVNISFIFSSVFLGFSVIGSPFIYCLMFIRGLGSGAMLGYLYITYGFIGVGYAALTMFPSMIISMYSLIMSCNVSSSYSMNAYAKAIWGRGEYKNNETRVFIFRQLILMIISVFASAIDASFSMLFSKLFSI